MILFFYNLALLLALAITSPWWLFKMATAEKYRDVSKRLGGIPPSLLNSTQPTIWLHAVSVGEVLAVTRLVQELDAALPTHRVVVSTTTRTGQALARQRFGVDRVFYCPLDLPWAVASVMKTLQPRMLILAETEFWPNLLAACFRRNLPVVVVNARISDRSWPRYLRLRRLWRPFLSKLSAVLAQSELDAGRLESIGCSKVSTAGNLKFDVRAPQESEAVRILRAGSRGMRLIVAGSTLEGEEAALAAVWPQLLAADPNLLLVVAPRHPERFDAAWESLQHAGLKGIRRSLLPTSTEGSPRRFNGGEIVLLDTIGELASVYSLASVAFVGGSLIPAGGHNPLEPAQFGVPIVMGPYYQNFREITETLKKHRALRIAKPNELADAFLALLRKGDTMGTRAREVFERQAGATAHCVAAIRALLTDPAPAPASEPAIAERRA
jgi:3-deoxy-D-manno-octulosonic-acid transferase